MSKICIIDGCGAAPIGHGLCSKHYQAKRRQNNPQLKVYFAAWYVANKERLRAYSAKWRSANKDRIKSYVDPVRDAERSRKWVADHPERRREIANRWVKNNPAKANAGTARRRAKQLQATPLWANRFFIGEIYDLANLRTTSTGYKWEVDHIVPLRHPEVCGLHVENNLRVIPKSLNASKGNRSWPDMPT